MVYRNNAAWLGAGFISVCLKTRWLGHLCGFYVPGCYCSRFLKSLIKHTVISRPYLQSVIKFLKWTVELVISSHSALQSICEVDFRQQLTTVHSLNIYWIERTCLRKKFSKKTNSRKKWIRTCSRASLSRSLCVCVFSSLFATWPSPSEDCWCG